MSLSAAAPGMLLAAAGLGGSGVAMGAFGAHALRGLVDPQRLAAYQTAVLYQMLHALALLALSARAGGDSAGGLGVVAGLWSLGVLLFCGSLYALVLGDLPRLGIVTPVGGAALMAGWGWLARLAWVSLRQDAG